MCVDSTSSLRRPGKRRVRNCLCRRPKCFEKSKRKREKRKYSSINIHVSHESICHSCSVCSRSDETIQNDRSKIDVVGNNEENQDRVEVKSKSEESINDNREFDIKVYEQPHSDDVGESNFPENEVKTENVIDKETIDAATSFQQLETQSQFQSDPDSKGFDEKITESDKHELDFYRPHISRSPSLNNYLPSETSDSSMTKSSSESSASKKNKHYKRTLNTIPNKIKRQIPRNTDTKSYNRNGTVNESYLISETELESTDGSDQARDFSIIPQIPNRFGNPKSITRSEMSRSINPRNSSRNSSMQSRRSVHFHPQLTNPYDYSGHRIPYQRTTLRSQTPYVPVGNNRQYKSPVYPRSPNTNAYSYNYANPRVSQNISQQPRQVALRNQYNHPRSTCCENPYKYRQWNGRISSRPSNMSTIISQSRSSTAIPESRDQQTNLGLARSSHILVGKRGEKRLPSVEDLGSDDSLPEYASEADDLDSNSEQELSRNMHDSWVDKRRQRKIDSFMESSVESEGSKTITRNRREYSWHVNENSNRSHMHCPWTTRIWEEVTYIKK